MNDFSPSLPNTRRIYSHRCCLYAKSERKMKSRAPCYSNEGTALHIRYYPFVGFSSFTLFQPIMCE